MAAAVRVAAPIPQAHAATWAARMILALRSKFWCARCRKVVRGVGVAGYDLHVSQVDAGVGTVVTGWAL